MKFSKVLFYLILIVAALFLMAGYGYQWGEFHKLADRLKSHDIDFVIEPYVRFEGEPGEQAAMFFLDPSGNALGFKAFRDESQIFATD
nr:hypothetical protein [Rhodohalobacter halophilus]